MAVLSLSNAHLAFGHVALLDGASLSLEAGERVGLIGRNGTGKSSLLKVIAGLEKLDDGLLQQTQGLRIRYVPQEPLFDDAGTVFDAVGEGVVEARERGLDALLPVPRVERFDPCLQRVELGGLLRRIEVALRGERFVAVADDARFGDAFADGIEHGAGEVELGLLRDVADARTLHRLQEAVVEMLDPGDDLQQRRLAGAVATDQADALAGVERKRRAVEERDVAEREMRIDEREDGHRSLLRRELTPREAAPARARARRRTSQRRRSRSAARSPGIRSDSSR